MKGARFYIAALATILVGLMPTRILAFREWVPPPCRATSERIGQSAAYTNCLYRLMGVTPAENLPAGTALYRELAILDSPAMPIFIEFLRLPHGFASLTVHTPDLRDPFVTSVNDRHWREVEQQWLLHRYQQLSKSTLAKGRAAASKVNGGAETVCIPQGSIYLEIVDAGKVSRASVDLCNPERTAFSDFLIYQAIKVAGPCARNAPPSYARTKRLLRCLPPPATHPLR